MKINALINPFQLIGKTIDERYSIIKPLVFDDFTAKFTCLDIDTGAQVAVIFFRCALPLTATNSKAFNAYAQRLTALDHPGLVQFIAFGIMDGNIPYLISEGYSGTAIKTLLGMGKALQSAEIIWYGKKVCEALAYLHSQDIIIESLTPSSIIIEEQAHTARLIHPGIFRIIEIFSSYAQSDSNRFILGSPLYISPEQVVGERAAAQSDLYSLGCVLYEMFTGSPPFIGNTPYETAAKHIRSEPSLMQLRDISPDLTAILKRCLARKQSHRWHNASELGEALQKLESVNDRLGKRDYATRLKRYAIFRKSKLLNLYDWQLIDKTEFVKVDAQIKNYAQRRNLFLGSVGAGCIFLYCSTLLSLSGLTKSGDSFAWQRGKSTNSEQPVPKCKPGSLPWSTGNYKPPCLMARETAGNWSVLGDLNDLEVLNLSGSEIDDPGLAHLRNQPLKVIELSACRNIHAPGLKALQDIPSLRVCNLEASSICDSDLDYLNSGLLVLNLTNCPITDSGVAKLNRLSNLRVLRLAGTKITDQSLGRLRAFTNLIYLDIRNCAAVPLKSAVALQAKLPHTAVRLDAVAADDDKQIYDRHQIASLIEHSTKVALAGTTVQGNFRKLSKLHELSDLSLHASTINDNDMLALAGLPLRYLDINESPLIHSRGLAAIKYIPTLLVMTAFQTSLRNHAMWCLNQNLVMLDLKGDCLHDDMISLRALSHLQMVRLESNSITTKSFANLRAIKTLKYLDLRDNQEISPEQAKELEKSMPGCTVLAGSGDKNMEF